MKALTLTQPWATLVAIGAKRIETRSWVTSYRGPLAIHAAKGFPKDARSFSVNPMCYEAIKNHLTSWPSWMRSHIAYPLGAVLATCQLVACVHVETLTNTTKREIYLTAQERAFGNYDPGRYAWVLDNVQQLAQPIPAKGALGLWEWKEAS